MLPIHRLKKAFVPDSVAVIGASDRAGSLGTFVWNGVSNSNRVMQAYPVNPKYKYLGVSPCWPSLADLPVVPDLAVIALPSKYVLDMLAECAEKGVRFVLLATGQEDYTADRLWREEVISTAHRLGIRVIGPESTGLMRPEIGLNVSYWPNLAKTGRVGLICQSGSVTASVLDYAARHCVGFSSVITTGFECDISLAEMVDFLASDPATGVIALHIETLRHPRALYSAIRAAGRSKPVVILKASSSNASRLISTRTATASADKTVLDALIRRAGAVSCSQLEEFLATIEVFSAGRLPRLSGRVAVIANGLGFASLAADSADHCCLEFAQPKAQTQRALAKLIGSPAGYVGYEDGGLLTDAIRKSPNCVLLLDEIEKAHQDIYNILLQVMDYARLTDNRGQKSDFRNVIIIMTSNAGAQFATQAGVGFQSRVSRGEAMLTQVKKTFKPEFLNRLSATVVFRDMDEAMATRILDKKLGELQTKLTARKVTLTIETDARQWLLKKGFTREYGAREMDRVIAHDLKPLLMRQMLFGRLKRGGKATLVVADGKLSLTRT